jgi:hypothetical protein
MTRGAKARFDETAASYVLGLSRITGTTAQLFLALALVWLTPSAAHAGFFERLLNGRLGTVQDGVYVAGDQITFQIQHTGKIYLLRFGSDPETFVLSSDHTSLGGRMLKYDSGEIAIRVSGWGALTLYTDAQPNGLPAVRTGDAPAMGPSTVSVKDVQFIAAQEAERLQQLRHLRIAFIVDWSVLETSADLRSTASEAMANAAAGIERFVQDRDSRKAIAKHINRVSLATGKGPGLRLEQKTLVVTFNPERGYSGCASSRAIARQLGDLLTATKKAQVAGRG